jgi:TPR repeat protein
VEVQGARATREVVRHGPEGPRRLPAPAGREWLAAAVRVTPPRAGATLDSGAWTVADAAGRAIAAAGVAGEDAGAIAPTFVLFPDAAAPGRLLFPAPPPPRPSWGHLYTTRPGAPPAATALTYGRVEAGRTRRSLRLGADGALAFPEGPAALVLLFPVPEGGGRFTLRVDRRAVGTVTASGLDAPPEAALEQGCAASRGADCRRLAEAHELGSGVPLDEARSVRLHARGCDAGDGPSCAALGHRYVEGRGVARDLTRAVDLFREACDRGHEQGCTSLGMRYLAGEGVYKDVDRAIAAFTKACDAGGPLACNNLGALFAEGRDVPREPAHAIDLYRRACAGGAAAGCVNLSRMYAVDSAEADLPGAAEAHARACGLGDAWSCVTLAYRYAHGRGVPKDLAAAATFSRRACAAGDAAACAEPK